MVFAVDAKMFGVILSEGALDFSKPSEPMTFSSPDEIAASFVETMGALATAVSGASDADESTKGIVELATGAESASSTITGGTGARLVPSNTYSTSSPYTSGSWAVWTMANAKIKQTFWDLTEAFNLTGTVRIKNLNASSTSANPIVLNGISFNTPGTDGASSTVLTTNGSGTLTFNAPQNQVIGLASGRVTSVASATTSLATISIPANTISTTRMLRVNANFSGIRTANQCRFGIGIGTGSATTAIAYIESAADLVGGARVEGEIYATSTTAQVSHFLAINFTENTVLKGPQAVNTNAGTGWLNWMRYLDLNTAVKWYLSFDAASIGGSDTCQFNGATVETLSNLQ